MASSRAAASARSLQRGAGHGHDLGEGRVGDGRGATDAVELVGILAGSESGDEPGRGGELGVAAASMRRCTSQVMWSASSATGPSASSRCCGTDRIDVDDDLEFGTVRGGLGRGLRGVASVGAQTACRPASTTTMPFEPSKPQSHAMFVGSVTTMASSGLRSQFPTQCRHPFAGGRSPDGLDRLDEQPTIIDSDRLDTVGTVEDEGHPVDGLLVTRRTDRRGGRRRHLAGRVSTSS